MRSKHSTRHNAHSPTRAACRCRSPRPQPHCRARHTTPRGRQPPAATPAPHAAPPRPPELASPARPPRRSQPTQPSQRPQSLTLRQRRLCCCQPSAVSPGPRRRQGLRLANRYRRHCCYCRYCRYGCWCLPLRLMWLMERRPGAPPAWRAPAWGPAAGARKSGGAYWWPSSAAQAAAGGHEGWPEGSEQWPTVVFTWRALKACSPHAALLAASLASVAGAAVAEPGAAADV